MVYEELSHAPQIWLANAGFFLRGCPFIFYFIFDINIIYFVGEFNKRINQLALVGFEMIISNSKISHV